MTKINFMRQACLLCNHATCGYKIGCLAVKDDQVLLEAWNETLPGEKYCQEGVCERQRLNLTGGHDPHIVCSIHAEVNLIAKAAAQGIKLAGCDIYVTTSPCYICSKSLVKAQIAKLYYMSDYQGGFEGRELFAAANIPVEQIPENEIW